MNEYLCALDIGASKIAACVAKINKRRILNLFFESAPLKSIKRGVVIDALDLVNSVAGVLKNLKTKSGIKIKFIYINISGSDMLTKHSRAIIPLAERGNKVITLSDIHKVNAQARILGASLNEEIIHTIPFSYTIDTKDNIINPLGLYSHRLEVDLYLICAKLSSLQTLSRAINQAGYEIDGIFFSGLATAYILLNKEIQKEQVSIICDIGSDITELLIFKDNLLKDMSILSLGGNDLTLELSDTLKVPFDLAEELKISYGVIANTQGFKEDREILVKKSNFYRPIKQKLFFEILTAKAKSICKIIRDTIEKNIECSQINNFIVIGRTVLQEGFLEMLENTLGVSVKLGKITDSDIAALVNKNDDLIGHKYLNYITCLGMICKALKDRHPQDTSDHTPIQNPILKAINRLKEVYQEYF